MLCCADAAATSVSWGGGKRGEGYARYRVVGLMGGDEGEARSFFDRCCKLAMKDAGLRCSMRRGEVEVEISSWIRAVKGRSRGSLKL